VKDKRKKKYIMGCFLLSVAWISQSIKGHFFLYKIVNSHFITSISEVKMRLLFNNCTVNFRSCSNVCATNLGIYTDNEMREINSNMLFEVMFWISWILSKHYIVYLTIELHDLEEFFVFSEIHVFDFLYRWGQTRSKWTF